MTSTVSSPPTSPGLLDKLFLGELRWDLLWPFPVQDRRDREVGDAAVAKLRKLLDDHLDPAVLDRTGAMPDGLVDLLRHEGYFSLLVEPDLNGLGLSPMNALRVLVASASYAPAVALMLGTSNGFGAPNYLPLVADGPLRDLLTRHVRERSIFGTADTEPRGAADGGRDTTAVPIEDGAAYLISGEKIFIGNALVAGLMDVSATLRQDGVDQLRMFFVELDAPGVTVTPIEFMGVHGAPFGRLLLDRVKVPAAHLIPSEADLWRDDPVLVRLAVLGRMLTVGPSSLAIAKLCLAWSRDFVCRRVVDGRPLGDYEEIQRMVAQTAADVFAIEAMIEWIMLSESLADKAPELSAAKNVVSVTCWRAMDRTLSLLAAEGYETQDSKLARGARPLPVERLVRDARGLRISGGVDFLLDLWNARAAITNGYLQPERPAGEATAERMPPPAALSPRCQAHLAQVRSDASALAERSRQFIEQYGEQGLADQEHRLVLLGQIGTGLLGMAVVLAKAARLAQEGDEIGLELADISCSQTRRELAGLWPQLADEPEPGCAAMSAAFLHDTSLDFLLSDVVRPASPGDDAGEGSNSDD
jgi:alkylation response protein AidB-like acyl-CoA dehydrogenase